MKKVGIVLLCLLLMAGNAFAANRGDTMGGKRDGRQPGAATQKAKGPEKGVARGAHVDHAKEVTAANPGNAYGLGVVDPPEPPGPPPPPPPEK